MGSSQESAARQLAFYYHELPLVVAGDRARRPRPAALCVLCGKHPAHLTVARHKGYRPAKLCLRCHHAVMRQRRMLRASLRAPHGRHSVTPTSQRREDTVADTTLIVSRDRRLSPQAKYATLS